MHTAIRLRRELADPIVGVFHGLLDNFLTRLTREQPSYAVSSEDELPADRALGPWLIDHYGITSSLQWMWPGPLDWPNFAPDARPFRLDW